jgi:heme exporter protein D
MIRSEWFYIWLSYGVTWVALLVYWFRLRGRRVAALRALTERATVTERAL